MQVTVILHINKQARNSEKLQMRTLVLNFIFAYLKLEGANRRCVNMDLYKGQI